MKKLDLDELAKESYESISVVIDKEEFIIASISADMLDKVQSFEKDKDNKTVSRMLSALTGQKEDKFYSTDFRKVVRAVRFITESCQEQLNTDPKNSEAEAK